MQVGLLKTSLVNFPGHLAAAVFLPGCNLRCPFCHNAELACASIVTGPSFNKNDLEQGTETFVSLEEALAHLDKRAKVLNGLAISGGEPLLSPALSSLILRAKKNKLAIKIDTNGTLPEQLLSLLENKELRPDMIAIDVKTSLSRYGELALEQKVGETLGKKLLESIAILQKEQARGLQVEYRTVLVPDLVTEIEIKEIASLLPAQASWKLAEFLPGTCLDPTWNYKVPYGPARLASLVELAKSLVPHSELR